MTVFSCASSDNAFIFSPFLKDTEFCWLQNSPWTVLGFEHLNVVPLPVGPDFT